MSGLMLSSRDRRTVVAGAVGVAALVLFSRGIPAWRMWVRDARASAAEESRAAADADVLLAGAHALRDTLAARNARYVALAPAIVPGATSAEASASLASLLSTAATGAGVKIGAVQLRPVTDTGVGRAFVGVGVRADFVGDVRGLSSLLLALEGGPVRLRVRELQVTQPDPAGPPDRVEALHGDLVVEGLALAHRAGR